MISERMLEEEIWLASNQFSPDIFTGYKIYNMSNSCPIQTNATCGAITKVYKGNK